MQLNSTNGRGQAVGAVGRGDLAPDRKEREAVAALLNELLECAVCADFASRFFSS